MQWLREICTYVPQNAQEAADKARIQEYAAGHTDLLTRQNTLCHLTASAIILNSARDKALMVYHNIYKSWSWTGGHADGDGDLLAVALREATEETGAEVRPVTPGMVSLDILPVWGHTKRGQYVSAHLHLNAAYLLCADEAAPLRIKPDENSGVRWLETARLEEYVTEPDMLPVYHKILQRAKTLAREETGLANTSKAPL